MTYVRGTRKGPYNSSRVKGPLSSIPDFVHAGTVGCQRISCRSACPPGVIGHASCHCKGPSAIMTSRDAANSAGRSFIKCPSETELCRNAEHQTLMYWSRIMFPHRTSIPQFQVVALRIDARDWGKDLGASHFWRMRGDSLGQAHKAGSSKAGLGYARALNLAEEAATSRPSLKRIKVVRDRVL